MKILVLNSGSSSQKSCLYEIGEALPAEPPVCMWEGKIEWDGAEACIAVKNSHGVAERERAMPTARKAKIKKAVISVDSLATPAPGPIFSLRYR